MVVAYQMWPFGVTNVCSSSIWSRNFCRLCDSFYTGYFLECFGCIYTMVSRCLKVKFLYQCRKSFCFRHAVDLSGTALVIGLTVTVGSFVSLPFLFLAEKIVDFWGHSNLLIVCFASYIIHFTCKYLVIKHISQI